MFAIIISFININWNVSRSCKNHSNNKALGVQNMKLNLCSMLLIKLRKFLGDFKINSDQIIFFSFKK